MIISVVMKVENSVKLGVSSHVEVLGRLQTFADCLTSVFLHLDVVEFPGKRKNIRKFLLNTKLKI